MMRFLEKIIVAVFLATFTIGALEASTCQNLLMTAQIKFHQARFRAAQYYRIRLLGQAAVTPKGFYSQNGQDRWLYENAFYGKQNGIFVDIGAFDGVSMSNSYFFENYLSWRGICVEPIPAAAALLAQNRKCTCVAGCISGITGPVTFTVVNTPGQNDDGLMLSGLGEHYDPRHQTRIASALRKFDGVEEKIPVQSYRFHDVIDPYGIRQIDYLSVDTEGSELDILQGINFERVNISVIGVENNYHDQNVAWLLYQKGFRQVNRIGQDDIYFHRNFVPAVRPSNE